MIFLFFIKVETNFQNIDDYRYPLSKNKKYKLKRIIFQNGRNSIFSYKLQQTYSVTTQVRVSHTFSANQKSKLSCLTAIIPFVR